MIQYKTRGSYEEERNGRDTSVEVYEHVVLLLYEFDVWPISCRIIVSSKDLLCHMVKSFAMAVVFHHFHVSRHCAGHLILDPS